MYEFEEVIKKFKKIQKMGYVRGMYQNKLNAGGLTLEYLFGKEVDNKYTPDYKGIELKTKARFSHYPYTLFTLPFDGPRKHEALDIASKYGRSSYGNSSYFINTQLILNELVFVNGKFYFELRCDKEKFYINIYDNEMMFIESRGYIKYSSIIKRANIKLKKIAFIRFSQKKKNYGYDFRYYQLICAKLIDAKLIIKMLKNKQMILELNLKYHKIAGKYKNSCKNLIFNLPQENLNLLFDIVAKFEDKTNK